MKTSFVVKLASPTVFGLMDNMYIDTFAFFTPYRILWDNFEKMMGAQDDPGDSIAFTIPSYENDTTLDLTTAHVNRYLADYMGLPHVVSFDANDASALPFRAYNKIWNDWFRDQNLQNSVDELTDDGPDQGPGHYSLLKRGKRFDYFSSSLPWPQKGDAVSLPLAGTAEVITGATHTTTGMTGLLFRNDDGSIPSAIGSIGLDGAGMAGEIGTGVITGNGISPVNLYANLGANTSATINDLRLAFQTQKLLERDARSGTRYVEQIAAHWKVTFPDYTAQRPIYLGGGSTRINVTPIAQTTYQGTQTLEDAKGAMAGIGIATGTHGFTQSFVEHGVLIILANVRSDITYSQGLERMWQKKTRYELMYPLLTQIGEQAVLNSEIYYTNTSTDDDVWGYIGRYDEYRYKPSRLSGLMRPDNAASLDAFHLSEDFSSLPTLSASFIESNTGDPLDRAISVPAEPHFIADFWFDMKCARPMPLFGIPGNMDRF